MYDRIFFYRMALLSMFVFLIVSETSVHAQTSDKTDTIPTALKMAIRGRQRAVSERQIFPEELSVFPTIVGTGDVVKLVQTLSGVALGSDGASSYYVRGGNMGGNVQTLDGVPIFGNTHLIGLTTAYSSEIVSSSIFQVGGFTSEEGNISDSHIKAISKDGDFKKLNAMASVSNVLLEGTVSAPLVKDKMSLIASFRFSPTPYLFEMIVDSLDHDKIGIRNAKALIYDAYAKLKYRIDDDKSLSLSAFRSQDRYDFNMHSGSDDSMNWENMIAILQYDSHWRKRGSFMASASFNHYSNSQGMLKQMDSTSNNLMIQNRLNEATLQARVNTTAGKNWVFQYGFKLRTAQFSPGSARILKSTGIYPKTSSPMSTKTYYNSTGILHGQVEYGRYEGNLFRLSGRLNYNSGSGLVPEASIMAKVRLASYLGVEVTGDHLSKFYHYIEGAPLGWSLDMIVPASDAMKPERTDQVYAGLYSDMGGHHLSAGAYYKHSDNLLWYADASKLFDSAMAGWEQNCKIGSGSSRGIEMTYEKIGNRLDWRISYTLSKTDRSFPELNDWKTFPAKFDRRHILNANASVRVMTHKKLHLKLSCLFTYQSGHKETVTSGTWRDDNFITGPTEIEFYTTFNNYRMPAYFRCDLGAMFEFFGAKVTHVLNIGVYNCTNRHNPFSLSYDTDKKQWSQISLLPIMPSLRYALRF